jgi:hypothetical protein
MSFYTLNCMTFKTNEKGQTHQNCYATCTLLYVLGSETYLFLINCASPIEESKHILFYVPLYVLTHNPTKPSKELGTWFNYYCTSATQPSHISFPFIKQP